MKFLSRFKGYVRAKLFSAHRAEARAYPTESPNRVSPPLSEGKKGISSRVVSPSKQEEIEAMMEEFDDDTL